ncbi:12222_t:CDS:2, partial [Gigaspora rosea]
VLVNIAYITVVNPDDFVRIDDASQIGAMSFGNTLIGETGKKLISILIVISSCGAASAMIFSGSEIIAYATRHDYIACPFSKRFYPYTLLYYVTNLRRRYPFSGEIVVPNPILSYAVLLSFIMIMIIAIIELFPISSDKGTISPFYMHVFSLILIFVGGISSYFYNKISISNKKEMYDQQCEELS